MKRITVLQAEDHNIVREGFRCLLKHERDIEVVGEAETGRQHNDDAYVEQVAALEAPWDFCSSKLSSDVLAKAIREAHKRNTFFSPSISKRLMKESSRRRESTA